jgi:hypothetical protein
VAALSTGAISAGGNVSVSGSLGIAGGATLTSDMKATGAGRVTRRVATSTSTNITAIGPSNTDVLVITSLASAGLVVINDSGASDGDELRVYNQSIAFGCTVQDPVAGTILTIQNSAGNSPGALFMRVGGTWILVSRDAKL